MLDTVVFKDQKAIDFFSSEMLLVKINAEADTVTARKYKVSGYPTTVLTDNSGKDIDRLVGYAAVDEYLETMVNYSKGIGTLEDLLKQAQTREDRKLYFEIADKYKYRGGSEEAETWYNKVIEAGEPHDSLSGESRLSVADMYRRAKDWDKALRAFKAVAAEFGGSGYGMDAEIYVAIVYRSMGDTAQAIAAFENYAGKYPESEDMEYVNKQIEKLKNPPEEEEDEG